MRRILGREDDIKVPYPACETIGSYAPVSSVNTQLYQVSWPHSDNHYRVALCNPTVSNVNKDWWLANRGNLWGHRRSPRPVPNLGGLYDGIFYNIPGNYRVNGGVCYVGNPDSGG